MALNPQKTLELYEKLIDALLVLLEPRYDPETQQAIPLPAATIKEIREFLKDNDVYSMSPADSSKAQALLKKADALFEPGVYHS